MSVLPFFLAAQEFKRTTGRPGSQRGLGSDGCNLASRAVVADAPAVGLGMSPEGFVGVDSAWVADHRQHRQVVAGVGVGVAVVEYESVAFDDLAYGDGLALTVQHLSYELAGVDAVDVFGDGAECSGQAQAPGDRVGDLDGCRGDEPYGVDRFAASQRQRGECECTDDSDQKL